MARDFGARLANPSLARIERQERAITPAAPEQTQQPQQGYTVLNAFEDIARERSP